ncbi:MAG: 50S ribosomal protein L15 [Candidatus Marinimicrobia bacterium]|nr:50S ribosomal protein L15 [Candidatus Neomarinimicrobiota bacterium]|tara:strand:+ start:159 stop:599 length:441 start_codon:yes stop_codon:yes gene_type:complete
MDLGSLSPAKGSIRKTKRIGRGNSSGWGRTAGRGMNGYKSRSGSKSKLHFEGGQTPLSRRLPKRGFTNYPFMKQFQIVNLNQLAKLELEKIDFDILYEKGLINKKNLPVKILGNGEVSTGFEIIADAFSQSAITKIEKSGGKVIYK